MMEWKVVVLILGCFVAYFGMFWSMSLTDVNWDFNINMDNNTLDAIQSLNTSLPVAHNLEINELNNELEKCNLIIDLQRANPGMKIDIYNIEGE